MAVGGYIYICWQMLYFVISATNINIGISRICLYMEKVLKYVCLLWQQGNWVYLAKDVVSGYIWWQRLDLLICVSIGGILSYMMAARDLVIIFWWQGVIWLYMLAMVGLLIFDDRVEIWLYFLWD